MKTFVMLFMVACFAGWLPAADNQNDARPTGTVTDIDGNVYQTVIIGSQEWMAENLKVTHYQNGEAIPNVTDITSWASLNTGAYCEYGNDINNVAIYGRLYNWYAASDGRNIAPEGWHVPTDADWKKLEMYLGMSQSEADAGSWRGTDEGGKLKEAGEDHWTSPNTGANNESGYTALPGGDREAAPPIDFHNLHNDASYWCSDEYNTDRAWFRMLDYDYSKILRDYYNKTVGFSVRCVKNAELKTGTLIDIDSNVYQTVKIGQQWWMAENLKVTHYRNGNALPNVIDDTEWQNLASGAYCEYGNDINNVDAYGRLYNWFAASDSQGLAPAGWHVANNGDWQILIEYLGGHPVAGGKMKETGLEHWAAPNTGATNESGFSALAGGCRYAGGGYLNMYNIAVFMTSTGVSDYFDVHNYSSEVVHHVDGYGSFGLSVRCVWNGVCGDANGDGKINVGDAIFIISYVFRGGPAPNPLEAGDANCDGQTNVGDAVYIITYVFRDGPAPCCP